jgi:hypothetical protein
MRKAQMSQVFTYLVIILVVGVIAIFGYKGIAGILKTQCDHQRVLFEKNLVDFIDEYSDYGSVNEETLNAPCDITAVCFVDSSYYESISLQFDPALADNDPVVASAVKDKTTNIFIKAKFTEPIGLSKKLVLKPEDGSFKCFEAKSGKFKFVFRGLGRKTQIESGWSI